MRAVLMEQPSPGAGYTTVRQVAVPRPGAGELSVEVAFAGVNFLDIMARRGDPGYVSSWPLIPGAEVAGHVREVGDGVTGFHVGDRVAAFTGGGGFAEVAVAQSSLVARVPDCVALSTAAAVPLALSTAFLLLTQAARFRPGDIVLMHSAGGGIGTAIAQLVRHLGGGLLVGTVSQPAKTRAARNSGWDIALARDELLGAAIKRAAPRGVDVVLDPLGTTMLELDVAVSAPGGRIILFGNPDASALTALPPAGTLLGRNVGIAGFSFRSLAIGAPERAAAALQAVLQLLADGQLDFPVSEVRSLEDLAVVHQLLAEGRNLGKYVVALGPAPEDGAHDPGTRSGPACEL